MIRKIKIRTFKQLENLFARAMDITKDPARWRRIWDRVGVTIVGSVVKNFEVGGRPKWKEKIVGRGRTEPSKLTDTNTLKNSIAHYVTSDAPVGGVKVGILRGPALRYGPVHELPPSGSRIRVRSARYMTFPTRSVRNPRPPAGKAYGEIRNKDLYGIRSWFKVKSVRVVRRPFLHLTEKEDVPAIARELISGIGDRMWEGT